MIQLIYYSPVFFQIPFLQILKNSSRFIPGASNAQTAAKVRLCLHDLQVH